MKTFVVDGAWSLKKNFYKRKNLQANGVLCGGSYGFLDSLRSVINKILPDRVIVMWDGFNAGKLRYEIYKPYKANRKKNWNAEYNAISTDGLESPEDKEKYEITLQKELIKEFLKEFHIRFLEIKHIEADDLIAYYILSSEIPNEEIIIYSRDKDYLQLISSKVSILSPESFELITIQNFKDIYGYTVENALLFKCFDGDSSDEIGGVNGVTSETLLKHFPRMAEEKYMYNRLVEECYNKKREKKLKFYDKIINSRDILYRNAQLMNLRKPFINEEVKIEMQKIIYESMEKDFSIKSAMSLFIQKGFNKFVGNEYLDLFFAPFFRIINKEKEFSQNIKK
jgi:DNA polymerase-1